MGSLVPAAMEYLPFIKTGIGIATNAAVSEASSRQAASAEKLALKNLRVQQAENMRIMQENAARDRAYIATQSQEAQREREAALKRAVARQKALFGATGIGGNAAGSSQAVLLGLFTESDDERAAREKLDSFRYGVIDQDIAQQNRLNVLQRTQLKERQKLNNLSSTIDRYGNYLDMGLDSLQLYKDYREYQAKKAEQQAE